MLGIVNILIFASIVTALYASLTSLSARSIFPPGTIEAIVSDANDKKYESEPIQKPTPTRPPSDQIEKRSIITKRKF